MNGISRIQANILHAHKFAGNVEPRKTFHPRFKTPMADAENSYAKIPVELKTTAAAAKFVETITFQAIPDEAIRIGTRCLLDGLGLFVAGSEEHTVQLLVDDAEQIGGRPEALLLTRKNTKVPAAMAARIL